MKPIRITFTLFGSCRLWPLWKRWSNSLEVSWLGLYVQVVW